MSATKKTANINRQILNVFLIQLLFISIITALGVMIAAKVVEDVMMKTALEGEAKHFWAERQQDAMHALPNTDNLLGFLDAEENLENIPVPLRAAKEGLQRMQYQGREPLVYVDKNNGQTLFLVFDEESVTGLSFYFGVVPLSLALIVLYVTAWFAYQRSKQAVSPLVQLAQKMEQFNVSKSSLESLRLDELQPGNAEVATLVTALDTFVEQIKDMIERERTFTRDVSHELRTPLTVVQGASEWLLKQPLTDVQENNVKRILRTSHDMSVTVQALLLLARGQYRPELLGDSVDVEIIDLVEKLLRQIDASHNQDGTIIVHVDVKHPLVVNARLEVLQIVLGNLLRNAYNYSLDKQVRIIISHDQIDIVNQTNALPEGEVDALFTPFYRGDQRYTGLADGQGLGLDIVRRLCHYHGWKISAHYTEAIGLVLRLSFKDTV